MNQTTYIVIATHNTGHGEVSSPVMSTPDVRLAYEAAIECTDGTTSGYEFLGEETGVAIYRLVPGCFYGKAAFRSLPPRDLSDTRTPDSEPNVYFRTWNKRDGEWREHWCNQELKRLATKYPHGSSG